LNGETNLSVVMKRILHSYWSLQVIFNNQQLYEGLHSNFAVVLLEL